MPPLATAIAGTAQHKHPPPVMHTGNFSARGSHKAEVAGPCQRRGESRARDGSEQLARELDCSGENSVLWMLASSTLWLPDGGHSTKQVTSSLKAVLIPSAQASKMVQRTWIQAPWLLRSYVLSTARWVLDAASAGLFGPY